MGLPIIGILADNLGRRFSIILCLGAGVLGYFLTVISESLTLALIGLCFISFGIESLDLANKGISEVYSKEKWKRGKF